MHAILLLAVSHVRRPCDGTSALPRMAGRRAARARSPARAAHAFGFDDVARRRARWPRSRTRLRPSKLPKEWLELDYDQYRDIRFRPDHALWRDAKLPFELMFFHPGFHYEHPVHINEVVGERRARKSRSRRDAVRLRQEHASTRPKLRVARVRRLSRALRAQHAEVQGRGAGVPRRELFPRARQGPALRAVGARPRDRHRRSRRARSFRRSSSSGSSGPRANATELTIYALLDSRRVTGAYRFVVRPGVDTAVDVRARAVPARAA